MWYSKFLKTSLRKHNLRVDLRVYAGDELEAPNEQDLQAKIKSVLTSGIIKGLDMIGLVSKFGVQVGQMGQRIAIENQIDIKVIPGQDYVSVDGVHAVFFNIKQNINPGLTIQESITQCHKQNGKAMLYDLSRSQARAISGWQSTGYEPDMVEIYNAHSKAYKDLDIDYPRFVSTAARSGSELEDIPVFTEVPRKHMQDYGFLAQDEGSDYLPGYLRNTQQNG